MLSIARRIATERAQTRLPFWTSLLGSSSRSLELLCKLALRNKCTDHGQREGNKAIEKPYAAAEHDHLTGLFSLKIHRNCVFRIPNEFNTTGFGSKSFRATRAFSSTPDRGIPNELLTEDFEVPKSDFPGSSISGNSDAGARQHGIPQYFDKFYDGHDQSGQRRASILGLMLLHPNELHLELEKRVNSPSGDRTKYSHQIQGLFSKSTPFVESPIASLFYPKHLIEELGCADLSPSHDEEHINFTSKGNSILKFLDGIRMRLEVTDAVSIESLKKHVHSLISEIHSSKPCDAKHESERQSIDNLLTEKWKQKYSEKKMESKEQSLFFQYAMVRPDSLLPWFHIFDDLLTSNEVSKHSDCENDENELQPVHILKEHQRAMIVRPPITLPRPWHNMAEGTVATYLHAGNLTHAYEMYLEYHDHILDPALIDNLISVLLSEKFVMRAYNVYMKATRSSFMHSAGSSPDLTRFLSKRPLSARAPTVSLLTRLSLLKEIRELRLPHRAAGTDSRAGGGGAAPSCAPPATLTSGHLPFAESLAAAAQCVAEDSISLILAQQSDLLDLRDARESLFDDIAKDISYDSKPLHDSYHIEMRKSLQSFFSFNARQSPFTFPASAPNTKVPSVLNSSLLTSLAHLQLLKNDFISLLVETLLATADAFSLPTFATEVSDLKERVARPTTSPTSSYPPPNRDMKRRLGYQSGRVSSLKSLTKRSRFARKVQETMQMKKDFEVSKVMDVSEAKQQRVFGQVQTLPTIEDYPNPFGQSHDVRNERVNVSTELPDSFDPSCSSSCEYRARVYRQVLSSPVALLPSSSLPYSGGSFVSKLSSLFASTPSPASEKLTYLARKYLLHAAQESYLLSRSPVSHLIVKSLSPYFCDKQDQSTAHSEKSLGLSISTERNFENLNEHRKLPITQPSVTEGNSNKGRLEEYLAKYSPVNAQKFVPFVKPIGETESKSRELWETFYEGSGTNMKRLVESLSCFVYSDLDYHPLISGVSPEMSVFGDIPSWCRNEQFKSTLYPYDVEKNIWKTEREAVNMSSTPLPMTISPTLVHQWLFDRVLAFDHEAISSFVEICIKDGVSRHCLTQTAAEIIFFYIAAAGSILTSKSATKHSALENLIHLLHGTRLQYTYIQTRAQNGISVNTSVPPPFVNRSGAALPLRLPVVYSPSSKYLSFVSLEHESVFAFPPPTSCHYFPIGTDIALASSQYSKSENDSDNLLSSASLSQLTMNVHSLYCSLGVDVTPVMLGIFKRVSAREGYIEGEMRAAQLVSALTRAGMQDTDSSLYFQASGLLAMSEPMPVSTLVGEHFLMSILGSSNDTFADRTFQRIQTTFDSSERSYEHSFTFPHLTLDQVCEESTSTKPANLENNTTGMGVATKVIPQHVVPDAMAALFLRLSTERLMSKHADRLFAYLSLISRGLRSKKRRHANHDQDLVNAPSIKEVVVSLVQESGINLNEVCQKFAWPFLQSSDVMEDLDGGSLDLSDFCITSLTVPSRIALVMGYGYSSEPESAAALYLAIEQRRLSLSQSMPDGAPCEVINIPEITRLERDLLFATVRQTHPHVVGLIPYLSSAETPSRKVLGLPKKWKVSTDSQSCPSLSGEVLERYFSASDGNSLDIDNSRCLPHFEPLGDTEKIMFKQTLTTYLSILSRTDLLPHSPVLTGKSMEGLDEGISLRFDENTPQGFEFKKLLGSSFEPINLFGQAAPYCISISKLTDTAAISSYFENDAKLARKAKYAKVLEARRSNSADEKHEADGKVGLEEDDSTSEYLKANLKSKTEAEIKSNDLAGLYKQVTPLTHSPLVRAVDIAPIMGFDSDLATTVLPPVPKPTFDAVVCPNALSTIKTFVTSQFDAANMSRVRAPSTVYHRLGNLAPISPYLKAGDEYDGGEGISANPEQNQQLIVSTQQILSTGSASALASPLFSLNSSVASSASLRTKWDRWRSRTARLFNSTRSKMIDEGLLTPDGDLTLEAVHASKTEDGESFEDMDRSSDDANGSDDIPASHSGQTPGSISGNVFSRTLLKSVSYEFDGVDRGTIDRPRSPFAHFIRHYLAKGQLNVTADLTVFVAKEIARLEALLLQSDKIEHRAASKRINRDLTTLKMFKNTKTAKKLVKRNLTAQHVMSTTASNQTARRAITVKNTSAADTYVAFVRRIPESHSIASSLVKTGVPHDEYLPTISLHDFKKDKTIEAHHEGVSMSQEIMKFTKGDLLKRVLPISTPLVGKHSKKIDDLALYLAWKLETNREMAAEFPSSLPATNSKTTKSSFIQSQALSQSKPMFTYGIRNTFDLKSNLKHVIQAPSPSSFQRSILATQSKLPSTRFVRQQRTQRKYAPEVYIKPWQQDRLKIEAAVVLRSDVSMFTTQPSHGRGFVRIRWLNENYLRSRLNSVLSSSPSLFIFEPKSSSKLKSRSQEDSRLQSQSQLQPELQSQLHPQPLSQPQAQPQSQSSKHQPQHWSSVLSTLRSGRSTASPRGKSDIPQANDTKNQLSTISQFTLRPYPASSGRSAQDRRPRGSGVFVDVVDGEREYYAGRQNLSK